MASTRTNVRDLGPCCLIWDPDGDNIDLGPTYGTVTFRSEDNSEDVFENKHGVAPRDAVFTGRVVNVEAPLTRSKLQKLETVIHDATRHKEDGKYRVLKVPNPVGDNMFPIAKELIIKPVTDQDCSTDTIEWIHVWRCYPIAALELGYDNSGQRVFNVTFKAFPDDASGQTGELWRMGPEPS